MFYTLAELLAKRMAKKTSSPDPELLDSTARRVAGDMIASGYERRNASLFDAIASYAASVLLRSEMRGLLLIGPTGVGKTEGVRCLSAILRIDYTDTSDYIREFGSPEYWDMLSATDFFGRVPRDLIIDELGTEAVPYVYFGTRRNVMAEVLQERYNAYKNWNARTIITTNLTLDELKAKYGSRVSDRFWESMKIIMVSGESLRRSSK